jgi:hypothetical protein
VVSEEKISNSNLDRDWLEKHSKDYIGCWVALSDGALICADESLQSVREAAYAQDKPFVITKIWGVSLKHPLQS